MSNNLKIPPKNIIIFIKLTTTGINMQGPTIRITVSSIIMRIVELSNMCIRTMRTTNAGWLWYWTIIFPDIFPFLQIKMIINASLNKNNPNLEAWSQICKRNYKIETTFPDIWSFPTMRSKSSTLDWARSRCLVSSLISFSIWIIETHIINI